jgi:hypothetical protein
MPRCANGADPFGQTRRSRNFGTLQVGQVATEPLTRAHGQRPGRIDRVRFFGRFPHGSFQGRSATHGEKIKRSNEYCCGAAFFSSPLCCRKRERSRRDREGRSTKHWLGRNAGSGTTLGRTYIRLVAFTLGTPEVKRIRSGTSALNQVNNEYNNGNHQQKMDQAAANVADKTQKPEHH